MLVGKFSDDHLVLFFDDGNTGAGNDVFKDARVAIFQDHLLEMFTLLRRWKNVIYVRATKTSAPVDR